MLPPRPPDDQQAFIETRWMIYGISWLWSELKEKLKGSCKKLEELWPLAWPCDHKKIHYRPYLCVILFVLQR